MQRGCVGAHLLRHEKPPIAQTREQKIRGGDREADWVLTAMGYDLEALRALRAEALSPRSLAGMGAEDTSESALYTLCHSATPTDTAI